MYIKNANESNGVHNLTKEYPGSKEDFYYWARIDHDGGFRLYRHFKKEDNTLLLFLSVPN